MTKNTTDQDTLLQSSVNRSRNVVLRFLTYGTFVVSSLLFCALLHSYFVAGHYYVAGRIWVSGLSLLVAAFTYLLIYKGKFRIAAYLLVSFYAVISVGLAWRWGVNLPVSLLFGCITIILSGMLIDPSKSLYMAGFLVIALIGLQIGMEHGAYRPDLSWTARTSNYGDIMGYAIIFGMLALISWLFGREIVRSLERAEEAEAGLLQEKLLLESRVIERTAKIRVMQLEKVQQLQRFAELGQLSTAMMHELANRLTSLSLDIEGLHGQQRSDALKRAQHSLRYIDSMAKNVSKRLHGIPSSRPFDTVEHTKKVVRSLSQKAREHDVTIDIKHPDDSTSVSLKSFGDSVQFAQILSIVVTNAIESYEGVLTSNSVSRIVTINFSSTNKHVIVRVIDHGKGIDPAKRSLLFTPFNSDKKQGMGVGLYIAKTMLVDHFKGNIRLDQAKDRTEFILTLPLYTKS